MTQQHESDPQFVERLGWELESALRRQQTIVVPSGITPERSGRLFLAAMLLAAFSIVLGAAGSFAVMYGQRQQERVAHVNQARLELEFAQLRLAQFDQLLTTMNENAERVSADDLLNARTAAASAEEESRLRELDLEETMLTGQPADDQFKAPLVKNRDFVSARLQVHHAMGERKVERLAAYAGHAAALIREGRVSPIDQIRAETQVRQAQQEVTGLERLLELRRSFLDEAIDAHDINRLMLLEQAKTDRAVAAVNLEFAQAVRDLDQPRQAAGRLNANISDEDDLNTLFWETRRKVAEQKIDRLQARPPDQPR